MTKVEPPFYVIWFCYSLGLGPLLISFILDIITHSIVGILILPFWVVYASWLRHRLQNYFSRYPKLTLIQTLRLKKEDLDPYR